MLAPGSAFESGPDGSGPHSKTPPRESQPLDLAKLLDCASQGARNRKNALRFVAGIDSVHWLFK